MNDMVNMMREHVPQETRIHYVITAGGPAFGTVTISYLTYLETFSFGHVGRGSALSFLISLFTLAMAFVYIRFLYRPEERY